MKYVIKFVCVCSLLLLLSLTGHAQPNVTRIEYYVDTDPGYENGIAVPLGATPGNNITNLTYNLDISTLGNGVHVVGVRTRDANGAWSLDNKWLFAKLPVTSSEGAIPNIARMEYYINTDPGYGNGIPVTTSGSATDATGAFTLNIDTFPTGVSILGVRTKDANGAWSHENKWLFAKLPAETAVPNISRVEYYIDTDPGVGNGKPIPITASTNLANLPIILNLETLSPCLHTLYIRTKDANGRWSLLNAYQFVNTYVSPTATPQDYMVTFDGINDYFDLGTWFNKRNFTLSFWVKPDSIQANGAAIAAIQNDLYLYANPSVQKNYILAHLLQFDMLPNQWNHITITMNGTTNTRKVYLFGQLIDSNQWSYSPQTGFNLRFGNGGFFPGSYFKGSLDEIKLWDHVISTDSIYTNVSKPLTGNEQGLLGYWNFNNGCNTSALDLTVNNHPGLLINGLAKAISTVPSIGQQIIPNKAGQGWITIKIYDNLFKPGSTAKLTRTGFADITADTTAITDSGAIATCVFNLTGKDTGLYNLVISNPNSQIKNYSNSFKIIPLDTSARINIQLLGTNVFRRGRVFKYFIVYQNTGNVDAQTPAFALHSYNSNYIAFSEADLAYKWQILPVFLGNKVANDGYNNFSNSDTVLSPGQIYSIPIYAVDSSTGLGRVGNSARTYSTCDDLNQYVLQGLYPNRSIVYNGTNGGLVPYINNGHNYVDGCSNPQVSLFVINQWMYDEGRTIDDWNSVFTAACVQHDNCYQTCYKPGLLNKQRAKSICDKLMYDLMLKKCETYSGNKEDCQVAALYYYRGLQILGHVAFFQNQSYCTGQVGIDQPLKGSGPTYTAPDCSNCPPNSICFYPKLIGSYDPNEKIGPSKFQNSNSKFSYLINFENKSTATAPAQEVIVIDTLDRTKFDINSFSFNLFGFGDTVLSINNQSIKSFSQNIDLRPAKNLIVKVEGRIDTTQGIAYWKFVSLDPSTMLLTEDPYAGFLPPADSISNEGSGWVSFNIKPYDTLSTGSELKNKATIIFDLNAPIVTNEHANQIDNILPHSRMQTLPSTQADSNFVVKWRGTDTISGVRYYNIYVSDNYGSFNLWRTNLSDTYTVYPGHTGHKYRFYSIATDSAGNIELQKTIGEASTLITGALSDSLCIGTNYFIPSGKKASGNTYQWQVNTGSGFQNIVNNSIYSQVNADTLKLTNPPSSFSGYLYRDLITNGTSLDTSLVHEVRFVNFWTGQVSTAWENANNWSCSAVPNEYTDVTIPSTTIRFPIIDNTANCKSLNLLGGASLNIKPGFNLYISGKGVR